LIKTIKVDPGDSALLHGLTEVQAFFPEEGEVEGAETPAMAAAGPNLNYLTLGLIQKGSKGADVAFAQKQLQVYMPSEAYYVVADGVFGSITEDAVKVFQKKCGLTQDGAVGSQTWARLGPEVYTNMASYWNKSASVSEVQRLLKLSGRYTGTIDGIFGINTENAIKNFQKAYGLTQDGIWGKKCWGVTEQGYL